MPEAETLGAATRTASEPPPLAAHHEDSLVVSLVQIEPRLGDVAANLSRHLEIIGQANESGADLVVFPELSLTGYFLKDLVPDVALRIDSDEVRELAAACRAGAAVVGCVLESDDERFYNAALYLSDGKVRHVHRKVYLPTYGLFDEQRYLAPGDRFEAFEIAVRGRDRAWRGGMLICEDMWHPSSVALLARQGVDVLICPSASPGRGVLRGMALGTAQSYDTMTRTYAQLYTAYLVYCNRVGYEDGINFWGGSRTVGPDGNAVAEPAGREPAVVQHRLVRTSLRRARIETPLLRDERHDVNDAETERIRRLRRL